MNKIEQQNNDLKEALEWMFSHQPNYIQDLHSTYDGYGFRLLNKTFEGKTPLEAIQAAIADEEFKIITNDQK